MTVSLDELLAETDGLAAEDLPPELRDQLENGLATLDDAR